MNTKKNIRSFTYLELEAEFLKKDEKKFRAKQVYEWIWKKHSLSFSEMHNIPKTTRDWLEREFEFRPVSIADTQVSKDKTIKTAFKTYDGQIAEGVLIPTATRMTACISSQVGCSLTCKFCATGKLERIRNLTADEIYDQVVALKNQSETTYHIPLSNIVYMGMGEPLLNYKEVLRSVEMLTSEEGLGMSPRRITLSTAGIAKMIMKLADDQIKFNLAISLHAANDEKRSYIMPINEQNSLQALKQAIRYFYEKTHARITYEYILFKDFNDSLQDAKELAEFCKTAPCKINLIEYNPIENGEFKQADTEKVQSFAAFLESKNLIVNVRRSRGKDIDAACGQLANKNKAVSFSLKK
ncbi:MAG: 23S rRNA (adenine(2503)-C(2))-methyltransferase RlmN [Bacteroidetes bacterium]|nr:23S rRNA (adenine(2503)-C(2))-methyltransferase RlmN [Bacteroidota bacterium]NOG95979.1 23S rRNA (adenine(2503)-C(2))-methyltransferase RlmN [Bacteroidota bacterium]GIK69402.1 MAG: putative dual-specificity RNA methyltransferase RlmN [Bacteroidota bacterium]